MKKWLWSVFVVCGVSTVVLAGSHGETAGAGQSGLTHRMMLLVIQLGVILFAARLGNVLFERIRLPGALGELVVGMLIGPYALGRVSLPTFDGGLFPMIEGAAISPELSGLCAVAAVVLLFMVGLETDIGLLLRYSLAGGLAALGGAVLSFGLGAGAVVVFSGSLLGVPVSFMDPSSLFMGTVAMATSVGITARFLSEKRKLQSPEGVTILSAAVIDDVVGIILLAVIMGMVAATDSGQGMQWGKIGIIAGKAVGFWLVATACALLAARKISLLLKLFSQRTAIAIMALGLALILAGLFEEAGLAMIIGAYVCGLSLSRSDISHVIREKLDTIYEFLIPVFFCVMGMRIDLGALVSPAVVAFGLIYAVVSLVAKVVGSGGGAMLANFNLRGALRIGFGMAPRCEVALIIAGIALAAGLLSAELFAAVIIMVLVNTVLAQPALAMLYRNDAPGTRKEMGASGEAKTELDFEFPSLEMAEFLVGKLTGVFEAEGFFVHNISRRQRLYQMRKDRTVIDFQCKGTSVAFSCAVGDVPLVRTAMTEALAAMERAIRGLKRPLDTQAMTAGIQEHTPAAAMLSLGDYLTPARIAPDLQGQTKEEVIDELLALLVRSGLVGDVGAAREAVLHREESMSTGLQFGVAIPHGKTDVVNRLVCAMGVHRKGMDFAAMDGQPSKIFFLTLSPMTRPAPHVQFMSTISQVLSIAGRQRVLACDTADQIHEALVGRPAPRVARVMRRPAAQAKKFALADYLRPELLLTDLHADTKEQAIDELLDLIAESGAVGDVAAVREAVMAREQQMSTGMEEGLAIPHGRTDAVEHLTCAIGIKPGGLDFASADGKPTEIIVLALTPLSGSDPYLQFAAAIISVLDSTKRARIMSAATPGQLHAVLTEGPR